MAKVIRKPQQLPQRSARGFTLIEILTVIAIISILAAFAYPLYTSHVTTTRRVVDGQNAILELSKRLEKFYTGCGSYINTIVGGSLNTCTGLELLTASSREGHYLLDVALILNGSGVATGYTINAVPQGAHATRDTDCGTLSVTNAGIKSTSGPNPGGRCWKK